MNSLHGRTLIHKAGGYNEFVYIHVEVMLCIGNCTAQYLLDYLRPNFRGMFEDREAFASMLSAPFPLILKPYFYRHDLCKYGWEQILPIYGQPYLR